MPSYSAPLFPRPKSLNAGRTITPQVNKRVTEAITRMRESQVASGPAYCEYTDADDLLAAQAAAEIVTGYASIDGVDLDAELRTPNKQRGCSAMRTLMDDAKRTATDFLVPRPWIARSRRRAAETPISSGASSRPRIGTPWSNWPSGSNTIVDDGESMMNNLTIELPSDGLPSPTELTGDFANEARFLLALKLFELGRITSGKAGRLCGMGRVEFLLAAGRAGVPVVDLTDDELIDEFA